MGTAAYSCVCAAGYELDLAANICVEVFPCQAADRGGCHREANCTHTGPGQHDCVCKSGPLDGWEGDGYTCSDFDGEWSRDRIRGREGSLH